MSENHCWQQMMERLLGRKMHQPFLRGESYDPCRKIVAAHGIRGEVKVVPYTDNPRRFRKGGKVFVDKINDYLTIASCRLQGTMRLF